SALAFSDPATLSCIANDFGYDQVFSRQVEAHGRTGDLLVALSTSGESENVVAATRTAREMGLRTVGLLGRGGGKLATEVDLPIIVPRAQTSDRIQEVHLQVLHAVIESIERRLFPENNDVEDPEV
ncbi:MAG: SIS domain-containing protein, partial [bacterium]|nr:SIS domain-containing protein [bacterium]